MTRVLLLACCFLLTSLETRAADGPLLEAIAQWDGAKEAPNAAAEVGPMSKDEASQARDALWERYRSLADESRVLPEPTRVEPGVEAELEASEVPLGERSMPFYFLQRGNPEGLRPMFIALHGGGGNPSAPGPHTWGVNSREWRAQTSLSQRTYPDNALYFVPRMVDDRDGRWYYGYNQDAFDRVVRDAIRNHRVDPNRVYLIGISEGAYTAYRLGAFMADRWAGAGSMAGGEPLQNAPPANMRNLAFRADIGERDTMFDRIGLNRRYAEVLAELREADPEGYLHQIEVQMGRGHGINYQPCPEWILRNTRNPDPDRVAWVNIDVHGRRRMQSYWLALDAAPEGRVEITADADRETNTITVDVQRREGDQLAPATDVELRVYLNDRLVDLDQPVKIVRNGETAFEGKVERRLPVMLRTLAERGDPNYCYPAEVPLAAE